MDTVHQHFFDYVRTYCRGFNIGIMANIDLDLDKYVPGSGISDCFSGRGDGTAFLFDNNLKGWNRLK
jgi:hypothetical protein